MMRNALRLTFTATVAAALACAPAPGQTPTGQPAASQSAKQFDFGTHRVQVIVPSGWEALDQGRQKRFRKGEREIVLENLGSKAPQADDMNEVIDWGLSTIGLDARREVKTRRTTTIDGREAVDIETWSRLDHSNPQKITLVKDGDDLLALTTTGMAFEDSLAAFDVIRSSFHFVSARQ